MIQIPFNNRYVKLGDDFYSPTRPVPVENPGLIAFNDNLATELGIGGDTSAATLARVFSGNQVPAGAEPLAMAYSGHQFGHFNPQLGDGRALLLGEVDRTDGSAAAIHLKGSGQTVFSRNGDGRSALGPVLREYLVSEAMYRLGVPTTRALAATTSGEAVARERLVPGGVMTRVASGFVRVGSFQFLAARDNIEGVQQLADFVISNNYPHVADADNPYLALLATIVERQAALIAQWMQLGFIHGVMNTDNMSVAGETIDYGPCAFIDAYRHDQVFSSIDRQGRYAYNNQPAIGLWNLTRLAETLLPLLDDEPQAAVEKAQDVLRAYQPAHEAHWLQGMRAKLGLNSEEADDRALAESLLNLMDAQGADFTLTYYQLSRVAAQASTADAALQALFSEVEPLDGWLQAWRRRLERESVTDSERQAAMQAVNPVYIPRNHQIEAAIRAAEDRDDFSVFHALHDVLQNPYAEQAGKDAYKQPPAPEEIVEQTFCGT